jgi:hypothetical protein
MLKEAVEDVTAPNPTIARDCPVVPALWAITKLTLSDPHEIGEAV